VDFAFFSSEPVVLKFTIRKSIIDFYWEQDRDELVELRLAF